MRHFKLARDEARPMRRILCLRLARLSIATLSAGLWASAAAADSSSLSVSVVPLDLGQVEAASAGTTTFQASASTGNVTVSSGAGRRLTGGSARALVTVTCNHGNANGFSANSNSNSSSLNCDRDKVVVTLGAVGLSLGRALPLANFTVAMNAGRMSGAVSGSNPVSFSLAPIGSNQTASFYVGADFPVAGDDSGRPTGLSFAPFYVNLASDTGGMLVTTASTGIVLTYRALEVAKVSDLAFGALSATGAGGRVTIDTSGNRSTTGNVVLYPAPPWSAASFTITGEGGQAFSTTVPAAIQLTGPATLTLQTTNNLPSSPTLSGALGSQGSFTLTVGASLPVTRSTPSGAYSGALVVSVDYN
jgi:hypothetical protein